MPEKNEVGDAFAAALRRMFEENPSLTIIAAADELGVSRQAFHPYLKGKLPRRKTLNRAMNLWNLKLDLGNQSFDKGAFGGAEKTEKEEQPSQRLTQTAFWEAVESVGEKDVHVTMKRVGKVLRFDVSIEIPA